MGSIYTAEAKSRNESINIGVCLNLPNPCKASNSSCVKCSSFSSGDGGVVFVGGDMGCKIVVGVVVIVEYLLLFLLLIRGPSSSEESAAVVLDDMINSGVVSGSYLIVEGLNSLEFKEVVLVINGSVVRGAPVSLSLLCVVEVVGVGDVVVVASSVASLVASVLVFVLVFAAEEVGAGDLLRDLWV